MSAKFYISIAIVIAFCAYDPKAGTLGVAIGLTVSVVSELFGVLRK